jgi:glucokinase-like ROK family protein
MDKVRHKNEIRRNLILKALLDNGQLSLTELGKLTGITLPVVSNIISSLVKEGLIVEVKDQDNTQAGRPPYIIKLNSKAGFIMGVNIGRFYTNFIVMDLEYKILVDVRKKSIPLNNNIALIDHLEKEIKDVITGCKISWDKLLGIGISIPWETKEKLLSGKTYSNKSIKELLQARFNKPFHIEHDSQAMALGELWFGEAKNEKNVLCINFSWGLGAGIILDGKVYYGEGGYAGEFGHIQMVPEGELCYCGKKGCLETVSSGRAMVNIVKQKIAGGAATKILNEVNDIEHIDSRMIFEAANQGDQFSIEVIEETGKYLGAGTAILINLLNPSLIILGGGVSDVASYLIDIVKSNVMKHSLVQLNKNVRFVTSKLGDKAGAMGVAIYLARDLFDVDHLNPTAYV